MTRSGPPAESRVPWYTNTPLNPSRSGSSTSSVKRIDTMVSEPFGETYVHGAVPRPMTLPLAARSSTSPLLRSESTPLGPVDSAPPSCHVPMNEEAPFSASKRPRRGKPFAAASGSVAPAGCSHVAGRLLLRRSAASCAVAVITRHLRCRVTSLSIVGHARKLACSESSVQPAASGPAASGPAARGRPMLSRTRRPGGANIASRRGALHAFFSRQASSWRI